MSYFGVLQKLYTLFSASSQRWAILKNHVSITLKMWAKTRWESKVKSVKPMRYKGTAVREALIEVRDNTKDPAIKAGAQSLSEEVGSYRFSICTVVPFRRELYTASSFEGRFGNASSVTGYLKHD